VDEVLALALNGVAVSALLTLAVLGSRSVLAVVGIVVVAVAGTAGLSSMTKARANAAIEMRRADRATDAALLSRSSIDVDHASSLPSTDWLTDRAHRALDRRAAVGRGVAIGPSIEVRQPSLVTGHPMNLPVDHGLYTTLAAPSGAS
jgi:hypothetical protein